MYISLLISSSLLYSQFYQRSLAKSRDGIQSTVENKVTTTEFQNEEGAKEATINPDDEEDLLYEEDEEELGISDLDDEVEDGDEGDEH